MSNAFRVMRGPTREISLSGYSSDVVEVGDLLFWDSENAAARPVSYVDTDTYSTYAAQITFLAANFAGVAMSAKAANESRNILVATDGDFLFAAPSGADTDGDVLDHVAVGSGTAVADQTVNVNAIAPEDSIGRLLAAKAITAATVQVRINSLFNRGYVAGTAASSEESSS